MFFLYLGRIEETYRALKGFHGNFMNTGGVSNCTNVDVKHDKCLAAPLCLVVLLKCDDDL